MKPTYLAITLALGICIGLLLAKLLSEDPNSHDLDPGQVAHKPLGSANAGSPPSDAPLATSPTDTPSASPSALTKRDDDAPESTADGFRDLMAKMFRGEASDDEQLKFWEEARTSSHLADVISELETVVDKDETEISARMNLAQAYTVKLLGVPAGPEKGLYAAKAENLWKEVLEVDPNHYEAQYSIATSLSRYPEFLNRTGDAIDEFERAIAIQEQAGSEIDNPNAYLELSRLHLRDSNPVSALETLENAAARHPDHEEIGAQLEKLRTTYVFEETETTTPPAE